MRAFAQFQGESVVDGREFLKIRIHLCHHGLAFSNLFSWVLLFANPRLCLFWGLKVHLILFFFFFFFFFFFSRFISNQHFCYVLSVSIFYSKIVLFLLHSLADFSLSTLHLLVGRIFLHYFWTSCLVCIVWPYTGTFLVFFGQYLRFISSSCVVQLVYGYLIEVFSFHWVPVYFNFLCSFACRHSFLICPSMLISYPGFVFLFGFLWGFKNFITN